MIVCACSLAGTTACQNCITRRMEIGSGTLHVTQEPIFRVDTLFDEVIINGVKYRKVKEVKDGKSK